jgi:DNA adenine methylase
MALQRIQEIRPLIPARAFLKWAGGKGQLLKQLEPLFPAAADIRRYHEPFLGSAAVYLYLFNEGWIQPSQACLQDLNPALICAWSSIRDEPQALIDRLQILENAYDPGDPATYYVNRERFNALRGVQSLEAASLLIALNRTCFNGLYRVNSSGKFNVPVGRYSNPRILDEANVWAVHAALQGTVLEHTGFSATLEAAASGDFVYFDPPYEPLSRTSTFRNYSKEGFSQDHQRELAEIFEALTEKGVKCMLSNSVAPFILELYEALEKKHPNIVLHRVQARRSISAAAGSRAAVDELVITNY